MHAWTTPQINELLNIKNVPLRIHSAETLKQEFLSGSGPGDVVIAGIDDEYIQFLSEAQGRDIYGPILLVSPEPTMVEKDLNRYNALVLDLKTMGPDTVRSIVHILLDLAARQGGLPCPHIPSDAQLEGKPEKRPIDERAAVYDKLRHVQEKELPAMIAFDIQEHGEVVTARSLCALKEVREDSLVFDQIKHPSLLKGMKHGKLVKISFTYKHINYAGVVFVDQAHKNEVVTSAPKQLFITREMRIQPNAEKPVYLYAHIQHEPTTRLKVFDISTRGIGFLCTRDLPPDRVYGFTIMLPDPPAIVLTSGIIRFKNRMAHDQYVRYGAEIRPHPWDEEVIAKYIMKRDAEIMKLVRNL